jgi:hypothetical protein
MKIRQREKLTILRFIRTRAMNHYLLVLLAGKGRFRQICYSLGDLNNPPSQYPGGKNLYAVTVAENPPYYLVKAVNAKFDYGRTVVFKMGYLSFMPLYGCNIIRNFR